MDCSLPGSYAMGILQARILEWIAMPSSRGSSWPRDWTLVSASPALLSEFFSTTWETLHKVRIIKWLHECKYYQGTCHTGNTCFWKSCHLLMTRMRFFFFFFSFETGMLCCDVGAWACIPWFKAQDSLSWNILETEWENSRKICVWEFGEWALEIRQVCPISRVQFTQAGKRETSNEKS